VRSVQASVSGQIAPLSQYVQLRVEAAPKTAMPSSAAIQRMTSLSPPREASARGDKISSA
jgi:hypothetical protein